MIIDSCYELDSQGSPAEYLINFILSLFQRGAVERFSAACCCAIVRSLLANCSRSNVNGRKYFVIIFHTNAKERLVTSNNINLCVLMYSNVLSDRSNVKTQICYLFAIRNLLSC